MTANIHTDTDFEGERLSHGALLTRDTSPNAHPRVTSIYRATILAMGTIPNDPLDDAGNGGGISSRVNPHRRATDLMSHTPVYDHTNLGEG